MRPALPRVRAAGRSDPVLRDWPVWWAAVTPHPKRWPPARRSCRPVGG